MVVNWNKLSTEELMILKRYYLDRSLENLLPTLRVARAALHQVNEELKKRSEHELRQAVDEALQVQ